MRTTLDLTLLDGMEPFLGDTSDFDLEDWQALETLVEVAGFARSKAIHLVRQTKGSRDGHL